jgi:hypothetical protein
MNPLDDLFSQIDDAPIPGGCNRVDAYQTVDTPEPGIHVLTVHHEDWCPFYRSRNATDN